jgi:radical SAM-linked protein
MARQPEGPPPPPVVQRLRIRYAKRGRLRFTSHRDFARAFERALRRAAIPMAYSAGFHPHPKVSYAGAAPTGVASEAEYLEIALAEERDPDDVRRALDAALPDGLDIVEVVAAGGPSLADRIAASVWRIELPGVEPAAAQQAVERFLDTPEVLVERSTKDGTRTVDARAAVRHALVSVGPPGTPPGAASSSEPGGSGDCAILELVVRHTTPAVRPDDVMTAVRQAGALSTPVTPVVTRLAQGLLDETPLAPGEHAEVDTAAAVDPFRLSDPLAQDAAAAAPTT